MTKRAYVDMSIEAMNFIMKLYGSKSQDSDLLKRIEVLEGGDVRLHLEGNQLPDTYNETPHRAQLWYESVIETKLPWKGTKVSVVDPDMPSNPVVIQTGLPNGSM